MKQQKFNGFLWLFGSVFTIIITLQAHAQVQLAKDQTLNLGIASEVPTLDPQKVEDIVAARVCGDLYSQLLDESETGKIVPGLASHYDVSKDGLTYTFHLRPNILFSDGSKITTDDIIFSFRRLVDPKLASTYSYIGFDIVNAEDINNGKKQLSELGVTAPDSNTIQIRLRNSVPYFDKLIALPEFAIVKKSNVEQYGDSFTQPGHLISSGPYQMVYWKLGDKITTVKNKYFWDAKNIHIEKVNYYPTVDANTELQMYKTGQIDFTWLIPPDQFKSLKKSIPNEVKAAPFLSSYYYSFNLREAPLKDNVKLRQALSMALDRNILTKDVTGRGELPAYDVVPKGTDNFTQQIYSWATLPAAERIAQAKKLYQEAGYSANNPLSLTLKYNTDTTHKKMAIAVAAMWQNVFGSQGLRISLTNEEWKVFLKSRQDGSFQIARDAWQADYNDASSFLFLFMTNNPQNNPKYSNAKVDALLQQSMTERDIKKRQALLQEADKIALNDYPLIPVFTYVTTHLVKPYIGGYSGKNALDHMYSRYYYIKAH